MARCLQRLQVDTYETGSRAPVVVHIFVGGTRKEAEQYHRAHLKTDSFLRGCEKRGRWDGLTCCVTRRWWKA